MNDVPTSIRFEHPPINEVVFGVQFQALGFAPTTFGLFWNEIKSEYPVVSRQDPIFSSEEVGQPLAQLPLPRVWFETKDKKKLIQLQANRFHFNWRQSSPNEEYPGFDKLLPVFIKEFKRFEDWAARTQLELTRQRLELSYINHFDANRGWRGSNDTQGILRAVTWPDLPKSLQLKGHSSATFFSDEALAADLRIEAKEGKRTIDNAPVLVVELTIQTQHKDGEMSNLFKGLHDRLLETFLALTTKEAQNAWNKR